jgi:periplasmic protein TonB
MTAMINETQVLVAVAPSNNLDEIVFENRNKEYGAYALRRKYPRFLFIGFSIAFVIIMAFFATLLVKSIREQRKGLALEKKVLSELTEMNEEDIPPPPPPPPPPAALIQQVVFRAPEVVDTVKDVELNLEAAKEEIVNEAPPTEIVVEQVEEKVIEKKDEGFWIVEESAGFKGGDINKFSNWVSENLVYPAEASEANISGKMIVQFSVNAKGEVCDVKVLRGLHPALDQAAIDCIRRSPKWKPAKQGGIAVKQNFSIPINFTLNIQ